MQDLTKVLKVGDRVWSIIHEREGFVHELDTLSEPIGIRFEGDDVTYWHDQYGSYDSCGIATIYPLNQKPEIPAPQWPEVFEIQGDVYKEGEWVAVSDNGVTWGIGRLSGINDGLPTTDKPNFSPSLTWQHIRKLTSFNK
jgi:hypothetical protein